jgi:hypothetical protein
MLFLTMIIDYDATRHLFINSLQLDVLDAVFQHISLAIL